MNNWQRIIVMAIGAAVLIVLIYSSAIVVESLNDENQTSLGDWVDRHWEEFGAGLAAGASWLASFLLGRRAGRKAGKTEAYSSAIAVAEGANAPAAADALKQSAVQHGLNLPG